METNHREDSQIEYKLRHFILCNFLVSSSCIIPNDVFLLMTSFSTEGNAIHNYSIQEMRLQTDVLILYSIETQFSICLHKYAELMELLAIQSLFAILSMQK